ncbi:MAG: DUF1150 family protein [Alphaproteobacteria bacterium]
MTTAYSTMLTPSRFDQLMATPDAVYVKPVKARDVTGVPELDNMPGDTVLFAVHLDNGDCVALVDSREAAFAGALHYDKVPFSVH